MCNCALGYRNGAQASDMELCMGPAEGGGRPCYPTPCNADWTKCASIVLVEETPIRATRFFDPFGAGGPGTESPTPASAEFVCDWQSRPGPSQFRGTPDCNESAALHSYGLDAHCRSVLRDPVTGWQSPSLT